MLSSDITSKFLERVILFKSKNDSGDFLESASRDKLIDKLLNELDFDQELIENRKKIAHHYFRKFKLLSDDEAFKKHAPIVHYKQSTRLINKALGLDPFNEEFLKEYLFDNWKTWDVDEVHKNRILKIVHPNTTDFQDYLVDLKMSSNSVIYDYLSEDITSALINEAVFVTEEINREEKTTEDQGDELRNIALDAGIDDETLKQINQELPEFIKSAEKVFDNHWLNWKVSHKATLSMEKALDFAPYNPRVLNAGIRFYGSFFWRLILGYQEIKGDKESKKAFFKQIFGKENPSPNEKWNVAKEAFAKALELEERYIKFASKKIEDAAIDADIRHIPSSHRAHFMRIPGIRFEEDLPAYLDALMEKEKIAIQVLKAHFIMNSDTNKYMLIFGLSIAIVSAVFLYFFFIYVIYQAPLIIGMFGALGFVELRKKHWQKKDLEISDSLSISQL